VSISATTCGHGSREPLALDLARVGYVGHATVLIELDGARVLTDPLLRKRVAHLRRVAPLDLDAIGRVDVVLISHAHHDHLDIPSLRKLDRRALVVAPRGLGTLLRRLGFGRVVEVVEGEDVDAGGLRVRATPAEHDAGRVFGVRAEPVGFAVLGTQRMFFAGDTELFDGLEGLVDDLDLALLPIWGWGPTLGRGGHLDPASAAEAARRLRPRIAVPIHWGTYAPWHRSIFGVPSFVRPPAQAFERAVRERAPGIDVRVLEPGESLELD
jgi:L-ascorbate metabolism protein UlaG (beta-lactamase superfamily)